MITVYAENVYPSSAIAVAKFDSEELYNRCLPIIEAYYKERGFDIITESLDEKEL
jgi:hypothetical protein